MLTPDEKLERARYEQILDIWLFFAKVMRVVDGDTLIAVIDRGKKDYTDDQSVRVEFIDCPEKKTDPVGWQKAKDYVTGLDLEGHWLVIRSHKIDDFGRWLADVLFIGADGILHNLGTALLTEGLAVAFKR